jgi:hypothetical protein
MSDPAATLADVERVRERTRLDLRSSWYPMVVVGAAALGAAGIAGLAQRWLGVYWLAAFTACFVATGRYYRARSLRVGVDASGRTYVALWLGFLVALLLASSIADALGEPRASLAAQCAVIGVLYLLFGRLQPSRVLGGIGVGVIVLGAGLAVTDPGHDAARANLCLGAALVLGGLYELSREDAT